MFITSGQKYLNKFGRNGRGAYLWYMKANNKIQFIISSVIGKAAFTTFKFETKEEGFKFLAEHKLLHRLIDVL